MIIKVGYLLSGAFASYSVGMNSSANVTALYYDMAYAQTGIAANLLTDLRLTATIGGIAIAVGVLTFSRRGPCARYRSRPFQHLKAHRSGVGHRPRWLAY